MEIRNLPGSINKTITFIENGINYELFVTDDILIKNPDDTYCVNVYKDLCKVCGRASTVDMRPNKFRRVKVEGNVFEKSKFAELVDKEANSVFEKLQKLI